MKVRLKRIFTGDLSGPIHGERGYGMWVECEATHPPSARGRGVMLYLSDEDVTELLLILRERAILVRR